MVSIATCKNIGFRRDPGWNRSSNNLLVEETDYIGLFCLFVWGFPLEKYLTPIEMSPLPVKGSKYWPMFGTGLLSGDGSLACHSYYDTRHLFIMVISEGGRGWDSNTQPSACLVKALTDCDTAASTTRCGHYEDATLKSLVTAGVARESFLPTHRLEVPNIGRILQPVAYNGDDL